MTHALRDTTAVEAKRTVFGDGLRDATMFKEI